MASKPIRVLYDDQGFFEPMGGVSRYFVEVIKHLPKNVEYKLPLVSTSNAYLREPPFSLPPHKQSIQDFIRICCHNRAFPGVSHVYRLCARLFPRMFPSGEWANQKAVRNELLKGDFDIYHLTAPHLVRDDWKLVAGKKPIVVTVHDLIPEMFSGDKRIARCRAKLLSAATEIIAVSENTKHDLVRLYNVPEAKITVIYHGYLSATSSDGKIVSKDIVNQPYLLFVGKRSGYKNFLWFIRAVAPLLKDGLRLVCTGSPFSETEKAYLKELGVVDRVSQKFFSDKELISAFANALAFVYPSRYEGFGIPILDSFAVGCPVILANSSCFPEIGGDAALYFNLDDEEGLREQVLRLLKPDADSLRQDMIAKGHSRVSAFSWQKCADQTASVYERCMQR